MERQVVEQGPAPALLEDFADWVGPHLPVMAGLAARLAPGADRDDVVQEALVRAWRRRATYDPRRGTARTWLLAVTADQARRSARRQRTAPPVDVPAPSPDLDVRLDVRAAIAALPERQRQMVELVYVLGLTMKETAVALGVAEGTVKSTLSAARARLRTLLEVIE